MSIGVYLKMRNCTLNDSTTIDTHKRLVQLISKESEILDKKGKQNMEKREEILDFLVELQIRTSRRLKS